MNNINMSHIGLLVMCIIAVMAFTLAVIAVVWKRDKINNAILSLKKKLDDILTKCTQPLIKYLKNNRSYVGDDVKMRQLICKVAGIMLLVLIVTVAILTATNSNNRAMSIYANIITTVLTIILTYAIIWYAIYYTSNVSAQARKDDPNEKQETPESIVYQLWDYDVKIGIDFNNIEEFSMPKYVERLIIAKYGDMYTYFRNATSIFKSSSDYVMPLYRLRKIYKKQKSVELQAGYVSYLDVWYYMYNKNPVIEYQKVKIVNDDRADKKERGLTLADIVTPSFSAFYNKENSNKEILKEMHSSRSTAVVVKLKETDGIKISEHIPSPLGITGVIEINDGEGKKYIVRKRINEGMERRIPMVIRGALKDNRRQKHIQKKKRV